MNPTHPLAATPVIREESRLLTYHLLSLEERAKVIHKYVATQIEYEKLYEPMRNYRTATETLAAKAGCCAEKSYLAIAMAREAGLDARYVSILLKPEESDDYDPDDEDTIAPQPRGHAGVNVHLPDKVIFLETTASGGYNKKPDQDELISFKEITDDQVEEDFIRRNTNEQAVEPMTAKDVFTQATNEFLVGITKKALLFAFGASLTMMYSCATQDVPYQQRPSLDWTEK